jgi:hypothetical protein
VKVNPTPSRRYEPADRPVRIPEYALFVALDVAAFAAFTWPHRLIISIGLVIAVLTLVASLARLLFPTARFSLTRAIFAMLAVAVMVLLFSL